MRANGAAITAIRERSGLTKTDLATAAVIDRTHLHRIEIGERNGTEAQLLAIARALKVPVTAIIADPVDAAVA
jgi:transcriptional regulator with XRE-family HTH domain